MAIKIKQDITKTSIIPFSPSRSKFVAEIDSYDIQTNPIIASRETYKDAIFDTTTSATFHKEGILRIYNALSPSIENLTPNITDY